MPAHVQACTAYECKQGCQKKVLELSQGYIMQQESLSCAEQDATYSVKSSPAIVQLRFVMTHVLSCTKPALQKAFIMLSQIPVVAWHSVHAGCCQCCHPACDDETESDDTNPILVLVQHA